MATFFYGNGQATIEGSDIKAVQLIYRGAVEITDKTSQGFALAASDNKIVIFPIGEGTLNELFEYKGEIKVISILVVDKNGEKVPTTIKRVMDYSELIDSNAEDMTVKSEKLNAGYTSGKKPSRTSIRVKTIPNLHTDDLGDLYLKNSKQYSGDVHIHINNGRIMTGSEHTEGSQVLYLRRADYLIPTQYFKIRKPGTYISKKKIVTRRKRGAKGTSGTGGY